MVVNLGEFWKHLQDRLDNHNQLKLNRLLGILFSGLAWISIPALNKRKQKIACWIGTTNLYNIAGRNCSFWISHDGFRFECIGKNNYWSYHASKVLSLNQISRIYLVSIANTVTSLWNLVYSRCTEVPCSSCSATGRFPTTCHPLRLLSTMALIQHPGACTAPPALVQHIGTFAAPPALIQHLTRALIQHHTPKSSCPHPPQLNGTHILWCFKYLWLIKKLWIL